MEQIRADIAFERAQTQWEPWKAMAAASGTGATLAAAIAASMAFIISRSLH